MAPDTPIEASVRGFPFTAVTPPPVIIAYYSASPTRDSESVINFLPIVDLLGEVL